MGNCGSVKSKVCSRKKKTVYQTLLDEIFHIARKAPHLHSDHASMKSIEKYREKRHIDDTDVENLESQMNSHMKGLIDYLERNQNKLVDAGDYVRKTVTRSPNPEIHILGLLVIRSLLNDLEKFSYDPGFLNKLIESQGIDEATLATADERRRVYQNRLKDEEQGERTPDIAGYKSDIMGNIIEFEGSVVEVLAFMFDRKRNPLCTLSFKYSLQVMNLFAKKHVGLIPNERIEPLLIEKLEIINSFSNLDNEEHLEINFLLIQTMESLAKIPNIVFSFKFKFIQYTCRILRDLYQSDKNQTIQPLISNKLKSLKNDAKREGFRLLGIVAQSLSDLNEFDVLISPIFFFFDESQWNDEQLQRDIFKSLIISMKDNTSLDQIEIYLIEKIVEYIDFHKADPNGTVNPYKHNKDLEVKAKAFAVLETVLETVRKSFLSFLVIDKLVNCFVDNLEEKIVSQSKDNRLKQSIYNCQKSFIMKINKSSKSLIQIINSLLNLLLKKFENDDANVLELLKFFEFSLDTIHFFPSRISVPMDSIKLLLKLREKSHLLFKTFASIEKFLNLSFETEDALFSPFSHEGERHSSKGIKLIPCEIDVGYVLLSSNLATILSLMEDRRQSKESQSISDFRFIGFLLHCSRINESLLNRKDTYLLAIQVSFIKKILDLSQAEIQNIPLSKVNQPKENGGLLIYLLLHFIVNLAEKWEIPGLDFYIRNLTERINPNTAKLIDNNKQKLVEEESRQIYSSLSSLSTADITLSEEECEVFLEYLVSQLKEAYPSIAPENYVVDFDEIAGKEEKGFIFEFAEDTPKPPHLERQSSSSLKNPTLTPSTESTQKKRTTDRKGSLGNFTEVVARSKTLKTYLTKKPTEEFTQEEANGSSIMDLSFKKALKEAHRQKEKGPNIAKIINEDIF